jgi:phosphatidate cytidylyltransferase
MSELGKRVLVAIVGIPTVLALTYLGGWALAVPLSGFAAWGAHECFRLARTNDVEPVEWVGVPTAAGLVLLGSWRTTFTDFAPYALALIGASTLLGLLGAVVARGPDRAPLAASSITITGAIYVGLALAFAPLLHALPAGLGWTDGASAALGGLMVVALPLVATWVGDAAALFAGTAWGKSKLAPTISPNKSWVGFWAALGGAAGAAVVWSVVARPLLPGAALGGVVTAGLAGAVLGLAAVMGDLVESLLKRDAGVKDSGTFFPGHGGVLDRIDSLIFTFPVAYCLLVVLDRL